MAHVTGAASQISIENGICRLASHVDGSYALVITLIQKDTFLQRIHIPSVDVCQDAATISILVFLRGGPSLS